ncbi:outer membrane beta-barrel protein [Mucilaginibacter sp. UR6-11]|uniref:outer membrane beta-barrel protein n=1 Tax=Mucilaginibacter sp. UR6-11 TaxID=1435644 RepID=UPI001E55DE58|nr:outer membrane beta-barrel protein [Mucilaginibacter sp. UR6-11]MCC8425449.1 outer membrane beta-barrel protein [Mucilaginibacter sp. UR6-11]
MRKFLFVITLLIILSDQLFAQSSKPLPPPLPSREVSGVVKDEKGETVIGALVVLKSAVDTLRGATNEDGVFVFKDVKKAAFNVTVSSIGSVTFVKKYLNSDVAKKIVLDPITLKTETNLLNEVKINGTPSVTYKTDTVEYRASDYKVRANATLDELVKKMEGMEVGSDGSLVHQGENVVKAKLNGKEFAGGSISQALKNLPADIVEKIQIVDDYGEQAARTGIKTGLPQKILNITTKPDRSVGITGRTTDQYGNNGRFNTQISVQRIDANQVISVIGNAKSTVDGIGGGNPGTTKTGSPSISYRDQWSKKIQVNTSYSYWFSNNNSVNTQYGFNNTSLGPSYFSQHGGNESKSHGQNMHFQMDFQMDSLNFLQLNPSFGTSASSNSNNYTRDQIDNFRDSTGTSLFQHRLSNGTGYSSNENKNYGINALYVHLFRKPKRNISITLNASHSDSQADGGSNKLYKYFADSTQNVHLRDSTIDVLTTRNNKNSSFSGTATYTEPLAEFSLLELRAELSQSNNNARSIQSELDTATGKLVERPDLSNIYNFSTTQSRYTANYRYDGKKVNLSIGATAIDYKLVGTKVDNNTFQNAGTSRTNFKIIPAFRFSYAWSRTQRIQLNYNGANIDPEFQQIQPFTDRSNPNNIIVGNPNLDPGFNHAINGSYNNYIANSRFNISLSAYANFYTNKITTNTLNIRTILTAAHDSIPPANGNPGIPAAAATYKNINEVHFINLGGSHSYGGGYGISKQLDDRRYNISLNGSINYDYSTAMSNNILYHNTAWRFDDRFGPRINPNDNIEINPYVGYNLTRTFTTSPKGYSSLYQTTKLAIDGRMYFLKTYQVNYSASKNFVSGIQNATNPFVVNVGFQKEFLEKRNLVLTFDVFDLLHQNSFIRQDVTADGGITNTISSTLSRYFMVGLRLNLQKWGGRPQRNGKNMQRRGDGSFIYN